MKKTFPELAAFARSIGREISIVRDEREWSQEQLAAIVDVDRGTIGNFETGRVNPSLLMFVKIAEALKVRPHQILEGAIVDYERRYNTSVAKTLGLTDSHINAQLVKVAKAKRAKQGEDKGKPAVNERSRKGAGKPVGKKVKNSGGKVKPKAKQ